MAQKITVECTDCGEKEDYETEKCIMILWTDNEVGVIDHGVASPDFAKAIRRLKASLSNAIAEEQREASLN